MKWYFPVLILGGVFMVAKLPSIAFENVNKFDAYIQEASGRYGVPFYLIKAMIAKESSFRHDAVPRDRQGRLITSARGLMQMTVAACQDVGYDHDRMFEPRMNIMAGTAYLARQIQAFKGSVREGVRAYYEGAGNRRRNSDNDPTNDRPERARESATYANKVFAYYMAFTVGRVV